MKESRLPGYIQEVLASLENLSENVVEEAYLEIVSAIEGRRQIFVVGNGGSAAIASHFVTDLVKSANFIEKPILIQSLVDNISLLSATANDFSYNDVFAWQLKNFACSNDLLFAISSSGNSSNILKAAHTASEKKMRIISLSGFDGGEIANLADIPMVTRSTPGNYGPVEDAHSIICHFIARRLRLRH